MKKSALLMILFSSLGLVGCEEKWLKECETALADSNQQSLAKLYCQKAAEQGSAQGQALFGQLLLAENQTMQAVSWLEKSANQRNSTALYLLGGLYETGNNGKKDIDSAIFYYKASCEQNEIKACERAESLVSAKSKQQAAEKERMLAEQNRQAEKHLAEEKRLVEEKRLAEEKRLLDERKAFEEQKVAEQKRLLEQQAKLQHQQQLAQNQYQTPSLNYSSSSLANSYSQNKYIDASQYKFYEGLAKYEENGLWGFINERGEIVIRPQFAAVGRFSHGRAGVQDPNSKLWGFIDTQGHYVLPANFTCLGMFREGLAGIYFNNRIAGECVGGKWGFVNPQGKLIIPFLFEQADAFSKGKAKVIFDGNTFFIDKQGKVVN